MKQNYKICQCCIMDTTDPDITFDQDGVCNHCHGYKRIIQSKKYLSKQQPETLKKLVERIKKDGQDKKYDCIIGVSGGVDSTYTAYKVRELGLRPLAVHLDNGWNSELAVNNIEKTLKKLDIHLFTYVLDWNEFKNLQLSFLRSSTPDSEIPTDHAILAMLYKIAADCGIKYILGGQNIATEYGGPAAWSQGHSDWRYIKSIYQIFTGEKLRKFPHYGPWEFFYYNLVKRIKWISILDYFHYNKKQAMAILQNKLGWKYYGGKHYESIYTRFFQGYILPKKFGFHKKRLHLSSLTWSGQMSRAEALKEMTEEDYSPQLQEEDRAYVIKKFGISTDEFEKIMKLPLKNFWDYPSYKKIFCKFKWLIPISRALRYQ